jgi:hypothetical protein
MEKMKLRGGIFFAAMISCFVAFMNAYPLVYPDTGTYIYSGFDNLYFPDRPIFYGFFLRYTSFAASPWFVIFAQALITCYMLWLTTSIFFEGLKHNLVFLSTVIILTTTTGYSYTVSILIPDIFTAVSFLCFLNLLLNPKLTRLELLVVSAIFVFSLCAHFSNLLIILFLFAGIFFVMIWMKIRKKIFYVSSKKILLPFLLCMSCFIFIPAVNYGIAGKFRIAGGGHVFMLSHLLETGVLEDYLKTACKNKNYKICEYKDNLGWDFIWNPESPFIKTGGWEANRNEYGKIIKEILSKRKYQFMLFHKTIEYSLKQLFTFQITVSAPQLDNSAPFGQIMWRFGDTYREYVSSRQNRNVLDVRFINDLQQPVILISFAFLFVVFSVPVLRKFLNVELKYAVVLIASCILVNVVVCANLSTVDPRFSCRVVWLLPLCTIITVMKLYEVRDKVRLAFNKSMAGDNYFSG